MSASTPVAIEPEPSRHAEAEQRGFGVAWLAGSIALTIVLSVVVLSRSPVSPHPAQAASAVASDASALGFPPRSTTQASTHRLSTQAPTEALWTRAPTASQQIDTTTTTMTAQTTSTADSRTPPPHTASAAHRCRRLPAALNIVAFGDSHSTEIQGSAFKKRRALPSYVRLTQRAWENTRGSAEPRGNHSVFAFSGSTATDISSRVAADGGPATWGTAAFDVCLVLAGTNDVLFGEKMPKTITAVVDLVSQCARAPGAPRVVLQAVPPVRCPPSGTVFEVLNARRLAVNRCLATFIRCVNALARDESNFTLRCANGFELDVAVPAEVRRCPQPVLFNAEELGIDVPEGMRLHCDGHGPMIETFASAGTTGPPLGTARLAATYSDCVHLQEAGRKAYAQKLAAFLKRL